MLLYKIYKHTFGADPKRLAGDDEVPEAEKYAEYAKYVHEKIEEIKKVPFQEMRIQARDGVSLYGRYYHRKDGATIILMFHGYRSSGIRDAM